MVICHACRSKVLFGLGSRSEAAKHGLMPTSPPGIAHALPTPSHLSNNDAPPLEPHLEPQKQNSRLADPSSRFA